MSVLFETNLTEYARQCTLQRRRYEECVQEAQRNGINQSAAACVIAQTPAETLGDTCHLDADAAHAKQGALADLLELSVEPSAWDDKQSIFSDSCNGLAEEQHSDRSQVTPQYAAHAARQAAHPVSYSAP